MYHATPSLENAALIEQNGFRASTSGLLGPGVYVSRDVNKAEQYRGSSGIMFEVLVRVGRVCHISPDRVPVPAVASQALNGASQRMVEPKDLVPDKWHDAGYDTAWVPADCSDAVFRGGAGWSLGHKEETCVFDAHRVTVLRRKIWESNLDDVNCIQWCFEEDDDRVGLHDEAHGKWVPFSRRLSTMLESHHLVYVDGRGKAQFVVTVESDRKHVHLHTGLQYEIDLAQSTQKNVMTGYQRRLLRRDMQEERLRIAQCVIQGEGGGVGGVVVSTCCTLC